MLLICPVRPGDDNEELRYALRSWEANLLLPSGLQLMTVGHQPSWLEPDQHVSGNRYETPMLSVFDNVRLGAAAAATYVPKDVLFMNDDFFCLDPMDSVLPVRRSCTLAEHIVASHPESGFPWVRSLALTASWLAERGFPHPDSYEVHRPLLASPRHMFSALSQWQGELTDIVPQWRTVYGVLNRVKAYPVEDVKLSRSHTGFGTPWVSTSDQTWRLHGARLRARFPKPSRWER